MNDDERLVTEYRSWKEEERLINEAIIEEVREDSYNEGRTQGIEQTKKEMVLNMHNKNISLDVIAECANLTLEEVKEIIDNKDNMN